MQGEDKMKSLILKGAVQLPVESKPPSNHVYDYERQIWIDTIRNEPVIFQISQQMATRFGETMITETREGVDQSEIASLDITSHSTSEVDIQNPNSCISFQFEATRFGETTITKTAEGVDVVEVISEYYTDTNVTYSHL